ncbi:hypothetical protein QNH39_11550 [Neobacillus novalis]|uniref:Uncharacterized protein n=1 Tax=Neobacillus novalis TaxID=220687 RepID=A0AA95MR27_9BACI|nr:hypothetical protein [Neobacillus novalis]WHY88426.1 hypothetical protein QNH39_11550 [Neobacillus novalis]
MIGNEGNHDVFANKLMYHLFDYFNDRFDLHHLKGVDYFGQSI